MVPVLATAANGILTEPVVPMLAVCSAPPLTVKVITELGVPCTTTVVETPEQVETVGVDAVAVGAPVVSTTRAPVSVAPIALAQSGVNGLATLVIR